MSGYREPPNRVFALAQVNEKHSMPNGVVLLSSRERKALFRAFQEIEDIDCWESDREHFLDELDDGGIWNPCFLVLPFNELEVHTIQYAINTGKRECPGIEHELRMLQDRLYYVDARRDEPKQQGRRWPFVMTEGYYGPKWNLIREEVIQRDGEACTKCGMTRAEHKDQYCEDLHVHHEKPLRECQTYEEANTLSNLRTLCKGCHQTVGTF